MSPLRTSVALALVLCAASCRAAGHLPVAREFAPTRDAFGDTQDLVPLLSATGPAPWTLLVGGADQVDALLAARAATSPAATIVDLSVVDVLQRDAVEARALEVALESDGPILLDDDGANARVLRGTSREVTRVVLTERRNITSAEAVPAPEVTP